MARDCEGLETNSGSWLRFCRSVVLPTLLRSLWPTAGKSCACALIIPFGLGSEGGRSFPAQLAARASQGIPFIPSSLLPSGLCGQYGINSPATCMVPSTSFLALPLSSQAISSLSPLSQVKLLFPLTSPSHSPFARRLTPGQGRSLGTLPQHALHPD